MELWDKIEIFLWILATIGFLVCMSWMLSDVIYMSGWLKEGSESKVNKRRINNKYLSKFLRVIIEYTLALALVLGFALLFILIIIISVIGVNHIYFALL